MPDLTMKDILLLVLGLFFVLNGLNHLVNTHVYRKYATKRGLIHPTFMVRISAVVLILGGASLVIRQWIMHPLPFPLPTPSVISPKKAYYTKSETKRKLRVTPPASNPPTSPRFPPASRPAGNH